MDCASGVVAGPGPTAAPAAGAAASVPARRRTGFAASPVTWILLAVTVVVYAAQWMTRDQASG
ncbi:rhomboid family intramembrane serine protease, partial [Salmonella enterica subsp. enterica serovar Typhimurium]